MQLLRALFKDPTLFEVELASATKLMLPIFTSEGNLHGGHSLWLIMITPTPWCGNGMCTHLATRGSYKFRL